MAKLYRCIHDFVFDSDHEVFRITDHRGHEHTMTPEQAREAYCDAVIGMVDSLLDTDTSGEEFSTETGVRTVVEMVPYIPNRFDRARIYPRHWPSPHDPPHPPDRTQG